MDFRLGNLPLAGEEIEVAAFIDLSDMDGENVAIAASVARRRLFPGLVPAIDFSLAYVEMNPPRRHVHLDRVAVLDEGQRPADEALRRDMQDAGAVARPAHASVGDAHHVAHP